MKWLRIILALFLILCCVPGRLQAQHQAVVDSLLRNVAAAPNDSVRADLYAALCDYLGPFDNEQRGLYARKLLALTERKKPDGSVETYFPLARVKGLYALANYHYNRGEYAEALRMFYECLEQNKQLDRKGGIAANLSSIARVYMVLGRYAEAEKYYLDSKAVYESIGFVRGVRSVLINFGAMLGRQQRNEEALEYYLAAEKTYTEPNDRSALATVYSNIGLCYRNTGRPELARNYYEKALQEYERSGEQENFELLQLNLGDLHFDAGDNETALRYYNAALTSGLQAGRKLNIQTAYNNLAKVQLRLGEAAATMALKDSLYRGAFAFNDLARLYADSVQLLQRSEQLAEMQVRYETEKKEREITQLGAEAKAREIDLLKKEVELRQRRLEAANAREQAALLEKTNARFAYDLEVNAANLRSQNADNERKKQEIALLAKEKALQEAETRRARAVSMGLTIGLVLFGLLLAVVLWLFAQKNRTTRAMQLQNREILRQRQEIEAQNRRLEEVNRYKSIFLSNMSHEIRTPLNTVINVSELLADSGLDERQRHFVDAVHTASENLLVLINDVLDLSKIEAGKIEIVRTPLKLKDFLQRQVDMLRYQMPKGKLSLSLQLNAGLPAVVLADAGRLGQVLLNLLGNALKFTEQGTVVLSCSVAEPLAADRVLLEFAVEDTGIGIATDKLNHIFDAFTQAESDTHLRYGGTGLGLTITRQLVELQGGTIRVESVPGKGSTFRFTLPAQVVATPDAQHGTAAAPDEKLPSCRILLAEDNPLNQMLAQELIRKIAEQPYIVVAQNGTEAVEKAQTEFFDLIFMDIRMPEMDGFKATEQLRREGYSRPIVALTANATTEEQERCRAAGMDDYLGKPVVLAAMREKIRKWAYPARQD